MSVHICASLCPIGDFGSERVKKKRSKKQTNKQRNKNPNKTKRNNNKITPTHSDANSALQVELQFLEVWHRVVEHLSETGHLGLHLINGHLDGRQHDLSPTTPMHHLHTLLDVRERVRRWEKLKRKHLILIILQNTNCDRVALQLPRQAVIASLETLSIKESFLG
jgi:hypothetical protein